MRSLPALLVAAALLSPALAMGAAGTVSFVQGTATRTVEGSPAQPLALGAEINAGDQLHTDPASKLELTLVDGSVLRLDHSSDLKLSQVERKADTGNWKVKATLALGSIWARVSKRIGGEQTFEINTTRVVAGVRGTEFVVEANENEHAVMVVEGSVDVRDPEGHELGPSFLHHLDAWKVIRVSAGRKTDGVTGIGGKNDLQTLLGWVKRFEFEHGVTADGPSWNDHHDRLNERRDGRHNRRVFDR